MPKHFQTLIGPAVLLAGAALPTHAHFQMIIPDDDMVKQGENRTVKLDVRFWHPMEGNGMNMVAPVKFGVAQGEQREDLLATLTATKLDDHKGDKRDAFTASYTLKKPGDHIFFVEPQPYWEPTEDSFIVHYTKVVVNGFGLEEGWDKELGMKAEIIPLTRPYGLWEGNVFQGIVKVNGKPMAFTDVEVEYFNQDGSVMPPADPMITQVIKTDSNGIFTYAMPWAGWWGFAALSTDDKPMPREGKDYPVELGALIWVKTHERR